MVMQKAFDPSVVQHSLQEQDPTFGAASISPFVLQFATVADGITPWGVSPWTRDAQLRQFWPTEPWLASAVGAIASRNAAFRWTLAGPEQTVEAAQSILQNANFGKGWAHFILQLSVDYLTQDNGAFIEVIRAGPTANDPVLGIAHLDAGRCTRVLDEEYPVYYEDWKGKLHRLGWWQVIPVVELPSPIETMRGIGFCAVSRILRAAQIVRELAQYKYEKVSGRFNRALHMVSGVTGSQIADALKIQAENADNQGLLRYIQPLVLSSVDPTRPISKETIELAGLPDGFDEEQTLKWYMAELALALGADYQDLAPLPGGNLGTSAQSEVLARKSSGKGAAIFQAILSHLINWEGIVPATVEFQFDTDDLEEEQAEAANKKTRAEARKFRIESGELTPAVARKIAVEEGDLDAALLAELDAADKQAEEAAAAQREADAARLAAMAGSGTTPDSQSDSDDGTAPDETPMGRGMTTDAQKALPDQSEWDRLESLLKRAVARGLAAIGAEILARVQKLKSRQLPLPGMKAGADWADDPAFWDSLRQQFQIETNGAVRAVLNAGALSAGGNVDFDLVNQDVLDRSRTFSNAWWDQLAPTTRDQLRSAITTWQEQGLGARGLPDLIDALEPLFGPARAERIAVTETTRLFADGRFASMARNPMITMWDWDTSNDDVVCAECEANAEGGPYQLGAGPELPEHPGCRCMPLEVIPD